MAGGGALNLSLLSRGVGEVQRNGHEKVEVFLEPEDYYNFRDNPNRLFLPPIQPNYAMVSDMDQFSSRDSREHHEIHLPKTFTTRKGALLLFSEDLALKDSERDPNDTFGRSRDMESHTEAQNLKTVDDLAKSILSYGNNEGDSVYMKFLHRKRAKFQRQIRPGFSAKRYLATWTRSWDDHVLETVINKGYITERSLFQYNFVIPHLRRRIFHEDLSHYPPPYRLMRNMLLSPGSLSGYTFYRAIPEYEDMIEEYTKDVDLESMRSRPPTSIKVIRTRNGEQREVSYASLDKKAQEEVITDLLVKSAVHYALRRQQEYLDEDIQEVEEANTKPAESTLSESEQRASNTAKTPVQQFDMKDAVESLLDSHRQLNFDADLPALDSASHSSYGGSFKGATLPQHSVKGHSAKTRSWPYGIDEAGKEYIGMAPVVSLREGSSSPSGSVTSLPQLPAIKKHPLTPIKDVSRETTQNFVLPPIHGADGVPLVSVEPPTPQHSTLTKPTQVDATQDDTEVHVLPSQDDTDRRTDRGLPRRKKRVSGDQSHHSSMESIPHSGVQSIPSKNRPHWKGSQQSIASRKGRVDFEKLASSSSSARSETGSHIGDGSMKGSIICAPDGEIISVGGSVGPTRQSDVGALQDVMTATKRVGDGEVEESIASDGDEPDEWKQSRQRVHSEGVGVVLDRRHSHKDEGISKDIDPSPSMHQWNYVRGGEREVPPSSHPPSVHSASIHTLSSGQIDHYRRAYYEKESSDDAYQSDWEKIAERPDEEALAMMESRAGTAVDEQNSNIAIPTSSAKVTPTTRENTNLTTVSKTSHKTPSEVHSHSTKPIRKREGSRSSERSRSRDAAKGGNISGGQNKKSSLDVNDAKGKTSSNQGTEEKGTRENSRSKNEERSQSRTSRNSRNRSRKNSGVNDQQTNQHKTNNKSGSKDTTPRSGVIGVKDNSDFNHHLGNNVQSRGTTPRSGISEVKDRDSGLSLSRERTPRSVISNDTARHESKISLADPSEFVNQNCASEDPLLVASLTSEKSNFTMVDDNKDDKNENHFLPVINGKNSKSVSDLSGRTSIVLEDLESPGRFLHRSRSCLTDRSGASTARRNGRNGKLSSRKSSSQSLDKISLGDFIDDKSFASSIGKRSKASSHDSHHLNLSARREKLPPLNRSRTVSASGSQGMEDQEKLTPLWTKESSLSDLDKEESLSLHSSSKPPSHGTAASLGRAEGSQLDLQMQVLGSQIFSASAPPSVRSSRTPRSNTSGREESNASEQMLVDALTEHAQQIAQSVLKNAESGQNLEADIRQAATLWTDRHPTRDISRSQSVQEKPNTDAIEEIMRNQRTSSVDVTAAEYREQIRQSLTTAVAKATGLMPDALPADADVSPELLEALANQSLSPEDIEIIRDEETGKSTLRSKSQLSKVMGGVKEGHIFVPPGGGEDQPVSIQAERVSVRDVGDVDVISYADPADQEQRSKGGSKASSKAPSVKDLNSDRSSERKPSEASQGVPDDLDMQDSKSTEKITPNEEVPAVVSEPVISPDDGSEKGSTKTGISKVSQKSAESKKSGKKKPVALEDREEFVVGKVKKTQELEQLYGPVEPPPPPKPSPPKPPAEKKPAEVVSPKKESSPQVEVKKESPREVPKLDIPREPPRSTTAQKNVLTPKSEAAPPKAEPPPKPKPAPAPQKVEEKPAAKPLPPIKQKSNLAPKKEDPPKTPKAPPKKEIQQQSEPKENIPQELPAPVKPATISVQPSVETETRATTPTKPEPKVPDEGRVDTKTELSSLYSQLPQAPAQQKKAVKGKPKAPPKVEKPLPPKKEVKKKEKKTKKKKAEPVAPPPPVKEKTPPTTEPPRVPTPKKESPVPVESPDPYQDTKSEASFVFVRDTSETPELKHETPVPREPSPPTVPREPSIEEQEEEDDDDATGPKQISNKDARLAKRAAAAAKKREEVERRRREKEEEVKRQKEEMERQEQLKREMEEERKRRDEERRLRKLRQEEERKKEEQAAMDRERRKQQDMEREKRAKEEYQRKLEEMRKKQAEEEERRLEAQRQRELEEEEARQQEEEMMSLMAEKEREEYERRKKEEAELKRQREEEEKRRREEEAQKALEEAKRLAEEMARRQAELEARLKFNRDLQLESHGLTHTQDITRMFVFSYFELLQWLGLDIPEFELQKLLQFNKA